MKAINGAFNFPGHGSITQSQIEKKNVNLSVKVVQVSVFNHVAFYSYCEQFYRSMNSMYYLIACAVLAALAEK